MEITRIGPFLHYFDRLRDRTLRVYDRVPPDRLEWRPGPERFSFGDLLRHVAALERYMYAENALGRPSRYPGHSEELASGYDEVRGFADRMHRETLDVLSTLSEADLRAKTETPAGTPITTWKWLRTMPEHEAHHRGQMYVLLREIGERGPPLYGLTSEEVRERGAEPPSG